MKLASGTATYVVSDLSPSRAFSAAPTASMSAPIASSRAFCCSASALRADSSAVFFSTAPPLLCSFAMSFSTSRILPLVPLSAFSSLMYSATSAACALSTSEKADSSAEIASIASVIAARLAASALGESGTLCSCEASCGVMQASASAASFTRSPLGASAVSTPCLRKSARCLSDASHRCRPKAHCAVSAWNASPFSLGAFALTAGS
mmetsp:Transcript_12830/g.22528  ORF Transcript_12830/g.22528 Transcript_12830/m.22528 type:complete len:207 (-) Transcript_12830:277-897(-)